MSHIVTVKTQLKNKEILKKICQQQNIKFKEGTHVVNMYSKSIETDFSFQLPNWRFPCAIKNDEILFDNYNENWGKQKELDEFCQNYAIEVVETEFSDNGMYLQEKTTDEEGNTILTFE